MESERIVPIAARTFLLVLVLLLGAGCEERSLPTSPALEQAVFSALGGLRIGEAVTLRGPAAGEIRTQAPLASEFVLIPFHASQARGATLAVEVSAELPSSADSRRPEPANAPVREEESAWEMHEELHERLRARVAPLLGPWRSALERRESGGPLARSRMQAERIEVGTRMEFNTSVTGLTCESVDLRAGRVEAVGEHAIIVADLGNPSGGFTRADYDLFAQEIDRLIHPTVTRYFGTPTDIDHNGRTIIFFTRAVNELTTRDRDGYVGGFFYGRDLFPKTGAGACAASNGAEILFILVPDPLGEASHIRHTRDAVLRGAMGTIGHEFQHLINAGGRIWGGAAGLEESWLDEGLSHIAEEVLFYADSGLSPRSNLGARIFEGRYSEALSRYGMQNLLRYRIYLEKVTRQSPTNRNDDLATRGAAWSFLRYLADHSGQPEDAFFRALVATRLTGFENLAHVVREPPLDWFRRWGVSVYTDDLIAGGDPLFQQPSWDFRQILPVIPPERSFPLDVRTLAPGEQLRLDLVSTTSAYIRMSAAAGEHSRVRLTSGQALPPSELQVTVIRVQ